MDESKRFLAEVFFANNGEIDLLTGVMAPEIFNQIVARDIQLADRNLTKLCVVYAQFDIDKFTGNELLDKEKSNLDRVKNEIETELVRIAFLLKQVFRQSDCISRVHQLGFWILLSSNEQIDLKQVLSRAKQGLPQHVELASCHRNDQENQIDWYKRIDSLN